jgi:hypothetical protein
MKRLLVSLAAGLCSAPAQEATPSSPPGRSRTVTLGELETTEIRVRVSQPGRTILTAVTFPAPVREILSAWNEKDLSLEHSGERLFVKLLAPSQGHLDALLASGRHVRLYLTPAQEGEVFDQSIQIQEPRPPFGAGSEGSRETRASGALELVRAMRLGEIPLGVTVRKGSGTVLFIARDLEATLSFVYEAAHFRGYIVRLANRSAELGYEVDLPRLEAEELVLSGARNLVVEPSSFTYLYLVFWKR